MKNMKWLILIILFSASFSLPSFPNEPPSGHILGGSPDAPVTIEVFSDFQCPSCRELYLETIRRILTDYSSLNKVCVIYHEFPLASHQYSREAARYTQAAAQFGRQKLLMVYEVVFMDQQKWSLDGSLEVTVSKVLSPSELQQLKKIMQDPRIDASIDREIKLGTQRKVLATPSYFISSKRKQEKVEGYLTYASLKQYIDSMLKQ